MTVIDVMKTLLRFYIKHYFFIMIKHFYQSDIMLNKTSLLSRNISEFDVLTLKVNFEISLEQVEFLDSN